MKSEIKKLSNSEVEIEIEISDEEFSRFIDKAVEKARGDLEIEGFRKGKAPKEIVKEKIGQENILIDAADMAIKENYGKAVLENKIAPISQPKIDILKLAPGNPLIFKAKTTVLPDIELPDYKKIISRIEKKETIVEEKEIETALNWLRKSRAKLTLKNGPAEKGDFIEIEYWSPQIKELSQTEKKKDAFILGEGRFIPGFEEKLIGLEAKDEEKSFLLTLPQNYPLKEMTGPVRGYGARDEKQNQQTSNGAGKEVEFKIKVKSVQKTELPEVNDQFAKNLGSFDNLEALKNNIKEGLDLEKKGVESQRIRNEILEKLSQASKFEIPEILIKKEQEAVMENFKRDIKDKLNIPFEDYLEKIKKTEKDLFDSFIKEAEKRVKSFLILRAIGEREKIEVFDEEARDRANEILKYYPASDKAIKEVDFERLKEYSRGLIKNEKIFKLLEDLIKK